MQQPKKPASLAGVGDGRRSARRRSRRYSLFSRTLILGTGLICLALLLGSLAQAWTNSQLQQRLNQEQSLVRDLRLHHNQLQKQAEYYRDPFIVESEARQQMGYIKPGEHSIIVMGAPEPKPPAQTVAESKSPKANNFWQEWWQVFFN